MAESRLDKYLAASGIGTRSEVKNYLKKNMVTVNGVIEKKGERKVSEQDEICFQGKNIVHEKQRYLMFHKPAGCVTATEDAQHTTVMDYIQEPRKGELFPVGRLDRDTEGLLLITDDGELAHRLLSPKKHVDKVYFARVRGTMTEVEVKAFKEGLMIGNDQKTLPAVLKILKSAEESEVLVTITEGRFHQIKRMFHEVGSEVLYLKRVSMGAVTLDKTLEAGCYRKLTEQEIQALKG